MEKKPKKRKSMSAQIKSLREENRSFRDAYYKIQYTTLPNLREEMRKLERIIPKKYYRIKYKIKAKNDLVYEYSDVIESYCAELAIEKLKSNKIHPNTFELIDITLMA